VPESGGGRPGLPVPNISYGLCGRKARFEEEEKVTIGTTDFLTRFSPSALSRSGVAPMQS